MAATEASLITQSETIRDETTANANTATRVGTFMRELMTWIVARFNSFKVVADLGTNGTTVDADSARELEINAGLYNASTTLTFSNVTNLTNLSMQLTNTNANTLTFAGITVYFKTEDLPTGVTFASNALTFPADSAVKYSLVGLKFDGSTFDCKIEIR